MTPATAGVPASPDPFRKAAPLEDDTIDLGQYVAGLWRYRFAIAAAAVVCAATFAAVSLVGPSRYEAEASVILSQSKIADRADLTSAATFLPLLQSRSAALAIIRDLGLDKPPHNMSAAAFFESVVSVEPVRNTNVLVIKAVLEDPGLAATVANQLADRAIDMSRRLSQQEAVRSRDNLQQQRDDARRRMEQAGDDLRKFREASQIELLRKDIDAMLGQRGELLTLLVQIESEKAKAARTEQELASRQRIGTVKRSIVDSDPAIVESARRPEPGSSVLGLETRNEYVDPVYEKLDGDLTTSRATLAALERRKAQLIDVRRLDGKQLAQLTRLYDLENRLADLQMENELAMTVYKQVATSYETARAQVASRSAQLDVLDRAVPPDRPMSRHLARNALTGFVLGFAIAAIAAAVYGAARSRG